MVYAAAGDDFIAECVGSTSFGGEWEISPAVDAALLELGWQWPEPGAFPHYRLHAGRADSQRLAAAAVKSLRLLDTPLWDVEVSRP